MENNLELWNKVEKTNPEYTKNANVKGNKITSIAPQYQIKQATEQFGIYGSKWGFKSIEFDYILRDIGMVTFKAVFYFPDGEFEIVNSGQLYVDNAQTKIDDNFAKKIETDTLTKALSKIGFNADIFLGKFDDTRYVNQLKKEFAPKKEKKELKAEDFAKALTLKNDQIQKVLNNYKLTEDQIKMLKNKIKENENNVDK